MADGKPGPGIPAWQRSSSQGKPSDKTDETATSSAVHTTAELPRSVSEVPSTVNKEDAASTSETSSAQQLENMRTFLEDPAVKAASTEKKRAFFESQGMSKDLIDQVLEAPSSVSVFKADDFENFKESQLPPLPQPQLSQTSNPPPIITYPEFLVEAHKPSPIITPERMWNAAYIFGAMGALVYGVNQFLITPMSESLNHSRHDFAIHSQSKIEELNERLGKLVSKIPEGSKGSKSGEAAEDGETASVDSDPTELFHRDIGIQTSPIPSRRPSITGKYGQQKNKSATEYQTGGLNIVKSHLDELLDGSESVEMANKTRQDSTNKLRHYMDTLLYASPSASMWAMNEETKDKKKEESIDELKKEIRGVKGLMLSARRFPPAPSPVPAAGRAGA